ncbi:N-acetylglucosaminyltransferase [Lachnospiraceae bacterium TWA4]|nr:N-acetylglucosaminyltransferase [Lachnospiraceae bacterium TWA4]
MDKKHKFMAIIPAHNESSVIVNLIESLKKQTYDKNLYDIYVIADNCTDNTAEKARLAGAIVYERFDPSKKTKGAALQWFLKQKIDENADYDAFFVFDADNIVDKNFITNMNKKLCQGETVVQGYRDIKNPHDNWITSGYALFYWTMHRVYHLSRYNLGLSCLLNGTGFMVRFDMIKPNGWQTYTLTEDIEFSLLHIIKNQKVGWAVDAIVYDEQPTSFRQSWSQRSRWTVGHLQCMGRYTGELFRSSLRNKNLATFDGFLYIAGTAPMLILTFLLLFMNYWLHTSDFITGYEYGMSILKYLIPTFLFPIIISSYAMFMDKKPFRPMIKGLLCYPFFMATWIVINVKCLFKRDLTWEKIEHVRNINIAEVSNAMEKL